MIKVNVHQFKTHLSKYLALLDKGETIVLCKRPMRDCILMILKRRNSQLGSFFQKNILHLHPHPQHPHPTHCPL